MKNSVKLVFCLVLFFGLIQVGYSRGDKIIPQIVDGPGWATNFDLTNISTTVSISHMRLAFYYNNGTPWTLQTNQGTGSSLTLNLAPRQTLRVKTMQATQPVTGGYAVIYDEEPGPDSDYSIDYVLGISVFYVVYSGSNVVDTVTVSVAPPTAVTTVPVEINDSQGIYSGVAVANWFGTSNTVELTLFSEDGTQYQTPKTFTLAAGQQRAGYLDLEADFFPGLKSFKGMAQFVANGPIALLGLLQTRAADGSPRYSTLVPVDLESLRRNTYMVLLEADTDANPFMPLDLDGLVSDFHRNRDEFEGFSWDLEYRYNAPDTTSIYLHPVWGAMASLGTYDGTGFDAISLPTLKAISYNTNDISLSGANLAVGRTFAVLTDLNNYAKMRIVRIIDTTDGVRNYTDLVLEVVVYK